MSEKKPTTYWDYIRIEELTALQNGLSDSEQELSNDEVLFITVHQVFELWFKLILRELRTARDLFRKEPVAEQELSGAVNSLNRVTTILRRCTDHFEVIETLTTRDFLAFRDKLFPASGFQSRQLRQIEIVMGLTEEDRIPFGSERGFDAALREPDGTPSTSMQKVRATQAEGQSLREAIDEWLYRTRVANFPQRHCGGYTDIMLRIPFVQLAPRPHLFVSFELPDERFHSLRITKVPLYDTSRNLIEYHIAITNARPRSDVAKLLTPNEHIFCPDGTRLRPTCLW